MPQNAFFDEIAIFLSAKKTTRRHFFSPSFPFPRYFLQLQQWWLLYCFAILGSISIVIHSVKQRLLRNRPGSDAATSRDFLRERLLVQTSFTEPANRQNNSYTNIYDGKFVAKNIRGNKATTFPPRRSTADHSALSTRQASEYRQLPCRRCSSV